MALTQPNPKPDDPRLADHQTTYQASRGGHYPTEPKPVPGQPKP
ncbi:hypothetical protein [Streptomyces sp. A1136]|nr:hypothetical protein [Streptomyces sp. A1136]